MGVEERFASLFALNSDQKAVVAEFLTKVREIGAYRETEEQSKLARLVNTLLEFANDNGEFREKFLLKIQDGFESCGDRAHIVLNELEILYQFEKAPPDRKAFRKLAILAQKYEEVKREARALGERDEVGAILYLHMKTRFFLDLPFSTTEMRFPNEAPQAKEEVFNIIDRVRAISDQKLLERSSFWQEYMERLYPEEAARISELHYSLLEEAGEYYGLEESSRAEFLAEHPTWAKFFETSLPKNYLDAVRLIQEQKGSAIARLDYEMID